METGNQYSFLTSTRRICAALACALLPLASGAGAAAGAAAGDLIEQTSVPDPVADDSRMTPLPDRKPVKLGDIDTENFEFGLSGGLLSVEDFQTNPLSVASLSYHITEDFFAHARFGTTDLGETSFETLSGGAQLLADEDRTLSFYDLSLGINVLPGESFLWNRWAMNSSLFLIGGVGATQFAGNDHMTISAGLGYRVILKDFLTINLQVRDHMFETDITGTAKKTHNVEFSAGLSVFF